MSISPEQKTHFSERDNISRVLIVGKMHNSTCDYYILPRISKLARRKIIYHDPYKQGRVDKTIDPNGCLVIINRYVNRFIIRWLEQNRDRCAGIVWVVDDDFQAMFASKSVSLINKIRPTITMFYQNRMKSLVDYILVSTERLATLYHDWPILVCPPVVEVKHEKRPIAVNQLYYFAKMHGPEHAFLFPIISKILDRIPDAHFTVIASGKWRRKWASLRRVNVLPEMDYNEYNLFLKNLPTGGIFLVPLTRSKLNASRSDAKLIEVICSGSTAIIADERAYRRALLDFDQNNASCKAKMNTDDWVFQLELLSQNPMMAEINRDVISRFMKKRWSEKNMIF